MNFRSTIDELVKLGAVSDEQARRSLDRLDALEQAKPDAAQVGRYSGIGAGAGALSRAVGHTIEHGKLPSVRSMGGAAAAGAIGLGAVPLVRGALDRRAETGRLKEYLHQGDYTPNTGAATDVGTPTGLSR